ncbi:rRNA processing protein [Thecaphora frezii]
MPKASKSKAKHADFQKTKLKLGKGKQQPNNATDTSFRSRTIALPQQSINKDKSGRLVTSRNLGVTDLAQQLRHYGAGVRKEAINGIREILTLHPVLISTAVGQLIPDICRVIGDDDPAVRKNLVSLLAWYLPQIPAPLLAPYLNALLLFTASALSHIYPEVRLDAVRILDILVQIAPIAATAGWQNAVARFVQPSTGSASSSSASASSASTTAASAGVSDQTSHGERFMSCYLNLLGITRPSGAAAASSADKAVPRQRTASTTATELPPAAKLLIFRSLNNFLSAATHAASPASTSQATPLLSQSDAAAAVSSSRRAAPTASDCPTWFFRSSFRDEADFECFQQLMRPDLRRRSARSFLVRGAGDDQHEGEVASATDGIGGGVGSGSSATSKGKKRKHDASTASDFVSADYGARSLVDVGATAGKSWTTGDLLASLSRAAALETQQQQQQQQPGRFLAKAAAGHTAEGRVVSPSLHLFSLLQPVMVATFLDTAPSAFRPEMDLNAQSSGIGAGRSASQNASLSTQAEIVSHLVSLCLTLWRASISASGVPDGATSPILASRTHKSELASLLGHMAAYFPFSQQGVASAASVTATLSQKACATVTEMDLGFSELTALLALSLGTEALVAEPKAAVSSGGKIKINLANQLEMVAGYISELLVSASEGAGAGDAANGTVSLGATGRGMTLDPTTYESLLPTVWLLLNTTASASASSSTVQRGTKLVEAVLQHYARCGSSSKVKALAFEFIARLCVLQSFKSYDAGERGGGKGSGVRRFGVDEESEVRTALGRWIESLPRYLWEVTASSAPSGPTSASVSGETTAVHIKVIEFLTFLATVSLAPQRHQAPSSTGGERGVGHLRLRDNELRSMRDKLAPFFCIVHPVKKVRVAGPYAKLRSEQEKMKAVALVEWIGSGGAVNDQGSGKEEEEGEVQKLRRAVEWAVAAQG